MSEENIDAAVLEDQAAYQRVLQTLMIRLGEADLHCEQARIAAAMDGASDRDHFAADLATRNLEVQCHKVIEFARTMALNERAKGSSEE